MSKISCSACGSIHNRNYECDAKRQAKLDKGRRDRERLDNSYYNTSKWRKLRKQVLDEYNMICLWSFFIDSRVIGSNCVHHIEEVLGDNAGIYEWDNLIPLDQNIHLSIVHRLYKTNCKTEIQLMLKDMLSLWSENEKELGSMKQRYDKIIKDV